MEDCSAPFIALNLNVAPVEFNELGYNRKAKADAVIPKADEGLHNLWQLAFGDTAAFVLK